MEAEAFPDISRLNQIVKRLNISHDWLLSTKKDPLRVNTELVLEPYLKNIPIIPWHQALDWQAVKYCYKLEIIPASGIKTSTDSFAVRMVGSSMEPLFPHGSLLIIDPQKHQTNRNYVLVSLYEEKQISFKQILIDSDKKYIKSISPDFVGIPPQPLSKDDVIIGSLVQSRIDFND